ncbi:MAG: DNA primase [bacterium]|nr:DNA primase [bacterium]
MSDHVIEDIKSRLDISEVIREYIPLLQAGGNLKAPCPFHREKTASFMVSPSKQIWHCFGCNEGGDVFKFIMKQEGMEFGEVLRLLADKVGVKLERQDPHIAGDRNRVADLLTLTSNYFHQALLRSPKAEGAREYIRKRGVDPSLVDEFKIGYSLPDFEALYTFLISRKYSPQEIQKAGLCIKKENMHGFYDRFRDRLMIPISTVHGQVVGFGGRILQARDDVAKYMNSPQTEFYDKSRIVFGLDKAKQAIREKGFVILVEGYMDFLAIYQQGIHNVVATSGTALTTDQIRLIKRFTQVFYFSFDMDTAGVQATKRGIDLALAEDVNVKIIQLPRDGQGKPLYKDPDECIKADPSVWDTATAHAISFVQFSYDRIITINIPKDGFDKKKCVREFLGVLKMLPDRIEQDHWINIVGKDLGLSESVLWEELGKQKVRPLQGQKETQTQTHVLKKPSLEEVFLALLLKAPHTIPSSTIILGTDFFIEGELATLYKAVVEGYSSHAMRDSDSLENFMNMQGLGSRATELILLADKEYADTSSEVIDQTVRQLAEKIRDTHKKARLEDVRRKMLEAERAGDSVAIQRYFKEFRQIADA